LFVIPAQAPYGENSFLQSNEQNEEILAEVEKTDQDRYSKKWRIAVHLPDSCCGAQLTDKSHSYSDTNTPETPTTNGWFNFRNT